MFNLKLPICSIFLQSGKANVQGIHTFLFLFRYTFFIGRIILAVMDHNMHLFPPLALTKMVRKFSNVSAVRQPSDGMHSLSRKLTLSLNIPFSNEERRTRKQCFAGRRQIQIIQCLHLQLYVCQRQLLKQKNLISKACHILDRKLQRKITQFVTASFT